ncbi:MAG: DUF4105 domain-containing protein [Deltaproteobacteria bacterium]|nr:DUF4105 domain-containing protein [Deltaproteobacteria bacterium]
MSTELVTEFRFGPGRRILRLVALLLLGLALSALGGWCALAIYYAGHETVPYQTAAGAYAACFLLALIGLCQRRWRLRALLGAAVLFSAFLLWYQSIKPSNERDWQPDVAVLPYATIAGDQVTIHNIRNCDYRTQQDFDVAYYDKTFDLSKFQSVDLFAVYWMGPNIAHTLLSFGFDGGDYVAISIETRKEKGEAYSSIKGFFRQYELYYVVADERDVVRLRTNYRHDPPEEVHLYRLQASIDDARRVFLQYLQKINALKERPEFYNTLTTNCTTAIWMNAKVNADRVPMSWKILLSGRAPEYLYEQGRIDTSLPFPELQRLSLVNQRAQASDNAKDFSRRIRIGLPGMAITEGASNRPRVSRGG